VPFSEQVFSLSNHSRCIHPDLPASNQQESAERPALHLGAHLFISSRSAVLNQAAYSSRSGISIGTGLGRFRAMERAGTRLIFGHDPAQWNADGTLAD
jgi:hypothetical protein